MTVSINCNRVNLLKVDITFSSCVSAEVFENTFSQKVNNLKFCISLKQKNL